MTTLRKFRSLAWPRSIQLRSYATNDREVVAYGDRVLLETRGKDPFLSKIIRQDDWTTLQYGNIMHNDLIGKGSRDAIKSTKGVDVRIYLPSLAEYGNVDLVTPKGPKSENVISNHDSTARNSHANLLVSLLDLHVQPRSVYSSPPAIEILEAGTGHGALTLHLARAIHGANIPYSPATNDSDERSGGRQAVIHTIDVSLKHTEHARKIVKGFRQGMYLNDIDFHVGDVSQWIDQQVLQRSLTTQEDMPFLSHIILDMPTAEHHFEKAATVLHVNGSLMAFNPSITQIMAIVETVKRKYLPLQLDRVVELGPSMSGGREWDVRAAKPRILSKIDGVNTQPPTARDCSIAQEAENEGTKEDWGQAPVAAVNLPHEGPSILSPGGSSGWEMICRPKVGNRIVGGGFLAVWKRMKW